MGSAAVSTATPSVRAGTAVLAPPRVAASGPAARLQLVSLERPERLPASVYRRRRAVAAGLVVAVVLAVWAAVGALGGGPLPVPERRPSPAPSGPVYVVQPGDTFWSIARRLEPSGDPRPLVDRLIAAHGGTTALHVGERIPVAAR